MRHTTIKNTEHGTMKLFDADSSRTIGYRIDLDDNGKSVCVQWLKDESRYAITYYKNFDDDGHIINL